MCGPEISAGFEHPPPSGFMLAALAIGIALLCTLIVSLG
jgi:hypothetical protein